MPLKNILLNRFSIMMLIVVQACSPHSKEAGKSVIKTNQDSINGLIVADTIIYEVLISNPNPDDRWTQKCLGRLHRKELIDSIFAMVYDNRVKAYNHETNEKLTRKQVKDLESGKGFSRDNIGMIQFTEAWYLNPANNTMTKKVLSMVLGYNFYSEDGELFGHKPVFRLEMNGSDQGLGTRD